jgi:hypothetical protein
MFKIYRVQKRPSLKVDIVLLRQIMLKVSNARLSLSVVQDKRKCRYNILVVNKTK